MPIDIDHAQHIVVLLNIDLHYNYAGNNSIYAQKLLFSKHTGKQRWLFCLAAKQKLVNEVKVWNF